MPVPATLWQPGMRITAGRLRATDVQRGTVLVTFTSQTSWTQAVTFPEAFPTAPAGVVTQIASGAGPTARWGSRAISVTPTGFTLFCFVTDAASAAASWADIPVYWEARV
ncbi:hypothetical protein ACIRPR_06595 [Streptomyces griseoflavus]|uniref:gp53-like domain-containing protein n=1 Tax=Streptomyces griseoflavus TaxID=35619 RepID=UPI0037F9987D